LQSLRKNISKILRISSEKKARNLVFFLVFFEEKDIVYLENKMSIKPLINEKNMEKRTASFICFIDPTHRSRTEEELKEHLSEYLKRGISREAALVLDVELGAISKEGVLSDEVMIYSEDSVSEIFTDSNKQDKDLVFIGGVSFYNVVAAHIDHLYHLYIIQVNCEFQDPASIFPEEVLKQWEWVSSSQYSESRGHCPYAYSCRGYKKKSL
jgi:hypothetical protein